MPRQPLLIPILHDGREAYQNVERFPFALLNQWEFAPEGLVVDGASVPRIAWWFLPPDGLHRAAALAHDVVYGLQGIMPSCRGIERVQADQMFYRMMRDAGVPWWRAVIAYRAVRLFGWLAWRRSSGVLIVLPVRNAAPTMRRKPRKNPFVRHLYEAAR